jgi:hypothetical protein
VLLNARRHAAQRGVALHRMPARIDAASSGRWFDGWRRGPRDADAWPREEASVAWPRSWLLAIGWRRAGLIDVAEVPGARTARR